MIFRKSNMPVQRNLLYSLSFLLSCQILILTSTSNAQTSTNFQRQIDRVGKITTSNYKRFLMAKFIFWLGIINLRTMPDITKFLST